MISSGLFYENSVLSGLLVLIDCEGGSIVDDSKNFSNFAEKSRENTKSRLIDRQVSSLRKLKIKKVRISGHSPSSKMNNIWFPKNNFSLSHQITLGYFVVTQQTFQKINHQIQFINLGLMILISQRKSSIFNFFDGFLFRFWIVHKC